MMAGAMVNKKYIKIKKDRLDTFPSTIANDINI